MREDTVIVERETDLCCYNPALLSGVDHHRRGPSYSWVPLGLAPPKSLISHNAKINLLLIASLLSMTLNF